jgi:SAM-dependent methyltransferase
VTIYGATFSRIYDREWAFWAEHLWPFLSAKVGECCPGARTWLDLCCGGGHLLRRICEAGYVGVGLDLSPHQLASARRNAPGAKLLCADVRAFELCARFDVVTCTFDSLNYLTEPDGLASVFARAARHLAEGGLFVFDMNVFEGLQDAWNRKSSIQCGDERVTIETSFDPETAIGRALISGFAAEGDTSPTFVEEHIERGYRAYEIEEMLTTQGFAFETLDGHSLQAPEARSARLLYVCHR